MSEGPEARGAPVGGAGVRYRVDPFVSSAELNDLCAEAWAVHAWRDFGPVLRRSLVYVCAYSDDRLAGFVNVAWDGGAHAFLLDTTVRPNLRRRGIGRTLVLRAAAEARARGARWLHVDFERRLERFYRRCGFDETAAGLLDLGPETDGWRAGAD